MTKVLSICLSAALLFAPAPAAAKVLRSAPSNAPTSYVIGGMPGTLSHSNSLPSQLFPLGSTLTGTLPTLSVLPTLTPQSKVGVQAIAPVLKAAPNLIRHQAAAKRPPTTLETVQTFTKEAAPQKKGAAAASLHLFDGLQTRVGSPVGLAVNAADAAQTPSRPIFHVPVHSFTLDNGLQVVVQPDHSNPVVAAAVTYKVGSRNETKGLSGLAHFFEHLMFEGTSNMKPNELSNLISNYGGNDNAHTMENNTAYHEIFPKSLLRTVLWGEADRMRNLSLTPHVVANEKSVVIQEMGQSVENQAYAKGHVEGFPSLAYEKWINQHRVLGSREDVRDASLEEIEAFYKAHYAPNNAVLTLVGDVTLAEAKELAQEYFGDVPRRNVAPAPDVSEGPIEGVRRAVFEDPLVTTPLTMVGWRLPPIGTRDYWALSLLSRILSGDAGSVLYQKLVKEMKMVLALGMAAPHSNFSHFDASGPHLFSALFQPKGDTTVDSIIEVIDRVLAEFAKTGPTEKQLAGAKTFAEVLWIDAFEDMRDRAVNLGSYAALIRNPANLRHDLRRMLSIKPDDVRRAIKKWLLGTGRAIAEIVPTDKPRQELASQETEGNHPAQPEFNPTSRPPQPEGPGAFKSPETVEKILPNGLRVVMISDSRMPTAEFKLRFPAGTSNSAAKSIAEIVALPELVTKGTRMFNDSSIATKSRGLGWSLRAEGFAESTVVQGGGLSRNLPEFLELLSEVIQGASYPADQISLWQDEQLEELIGRRKDIEALSEDVWLDEIFGDHAYALREPNEEQTMGLTQYRLRRLHDWVFRPDGAVLTLVGDFDPEEMAGIIEKKFAGWKGRMRDETVAPVNDTGPSSIALVDLPGATQASIALGKTMDIGPKHKDWAAFHLMNQILGNDTGRLQNNLRRDHGYTYGAYSRLFNFKKATAFQATAQTANAVTGAAITEMFNEINRLRDEEVPVELLEAAKRFLIGQQQIALTKLHGIVINLDSVTYQGHDFKDHIDGFIERIENITPADIKAMAKKYLNPASMKVTVVGDREALQEDLQSLGRPFRVVEQH
ncbi:MAG: hypothetical protein COB53_00535 [Elusimicrobia bacterium]|nr:MAG: hypothetical protein COB53_00535 [Elusimicrobiota bacterium]